jgi:hypothetical protein
VGRGERPAPDRGVITGTHVIDRPGPTEPFVLQKEVRASCGDDVLKRAGGVVDYEECPEIGLSALIRKLEGPLAEAEIMFDKPEDAAKVVAVIVYVALGRVGGHYQQRHPKAILTQVTERRLQEAMSFKTSAGFRSTWSVHSFPVQAPPGPDDWHMC